MKKTWRGRVLAMLLVLALTVGLVPAALAADSSTPVTFKQVSNDTLGTPVRPDLAVGEVSPLTPSAPTTSGEKNCPSRSFRDLDTTKWYHEAIDTMLNEGLMNGTGNGLLEPNATLTRAMLVTILWRSEGKPTAADPTPFTDVPAGSTRGILNGKGANRVDPNGTATRAEAAAMIVRFRGLGTAGTKQ